MIESITFYIFATLLLISALRVITARNPVHAVMWLVFSFFNGTGLLVLLGAELIAMLLAIVYVGAVAVLFLFVVMMLDIDFQSLREKARSYLPVSFVVGVVLLGEIYLIVKNWGMSSLATINIQSPAPLTDTMITNSHAIGMVLYTDYILLFQLAGLILFVAMIGAIVLTHRTRSGVRRQTISTQNAARAENIIELAKPAKGKGVS